MSARAASCPSCGAEVLFTASSSVVAVCGYCRAAVSRKGVNLENLGKVAELVPTSSPFKLGMRGKPKKGGYRPFAIVGRLQLSTGPAPWDEWYVAFEDGRYGWLAEAQGQFFLTLPMSAPAVPEFHAVQVGQRLDLSPYGIFSVAERRQALYVAAAGELPFAATPGSVFMYADLVGDDGSFATLDYGDDPGLDAFFVGRRVELADLGIEELVGWKDRKAKARASSLNCPSCGGALQLKDPAATVRLACTYCGSLLGSAAGGEAGKFEVLEKLQKLPFRPPLKPGLQGTLRGRPYVLLGAILKKCIVEGSTYFWTEYLLKETQTEAYHWLVESNGHWSLVLPISGASVTTGERVASFSGRSYRHFQKTTAIVEAVLGEFYWEVARGDTAQVSDWVAPPRVLSWEGTGEEEAWSEGDYLLKAELEQGLGLTKPLPEASGVGSNQPWPRAEEARVANKTFLTLGLVALALIVLFQVRGPRTVVYQGRHELPAMPPTTDAAREEVVVLTEPFKLEGRGNVELTLAAPTDNTWVAVGASLIDQDSGQVRSVTLLSDYYHGSSGGESWSEGRRSRSVFLSRVPAGSYVLRLEPQFEAGRAPGHYDVRVRRGVPRWYPFWVLLGVLVLGPAFYGISYSSFEARRWSESDYGSATGSSSDEDDE